jgi:hypothetical protein
MNFIKILEKQFLFWNQDSYPYYFNTRGYDYLSYESEFGQSKDMLDKLCNLLGTDNLDWNNHYSFNIK